MKRSSWRNSTEYGLTAGIFSEDDREIEQFFSGITGRGHIRKPAGGCHHRGVARHQFLWWLESERIDRPWNRRPVLRSAVHAGAESSPDTVIRRTSNQHFSV